MGGREGPPCLWGQPHDSPPDKAGENELELGGRGAVTLTREEPGR